MSVRVLSDLISPAFNEDTIYKIILTSGELTEVKTYKIIIDDKTSKKGDSYLSTICRFGIFATGLNDSGENVEVTIQLISKAFPKNIARRKTFRSVDFFKTEIDFYNKVWPEMQKFKLSKIKDEINEVPRVLITHCDGENDFLVLEDLSYQGYAAASRDDNLSVEIISKYLTLLAHFHALSFVLKQNNPNFVQIAKSLEDTYFSEKLRPWYENYMYNSMQPLYQKAVKKNLPEMYYEKLTNLFSSDFFGALIKACNVDNKYCVVTEGDAWLPNFLSKLEEGELKVVLIDFQLARYSTFSNDVLQFLFSGVPTDLLSNEWDNFILHYHSSLTDRIEKLGGDKNEITLGELKEAIISNSLVGVLMALESAINGALTDDEITDIDLLQGEDAIPLEDVWIIPEFDEERNKKLAFLIKLLIDKGLIP